MKLFLGVDEDNVHTQITPEARFYEYVYTFKDTSVYKSKASINPHYQLLIENTSIRMFVGGKCIEEFEALDRTCVRSYLARKYLEYMIKNPVLFYDLVYVLGRNRF